MDEIIQEEIEQIRSDLQDEDSTDSLRTLLLREFPQKDIALVARKNGSPKYNVEIAFFSRDEAINYLNEMQSLGDGYRRKIIVGSLLELDRYGLESASDSLGKKFVYSHLENRL